MIFIMYVVVYDLDSSSLPKADEITFPSFDDICLLVILPFNNGIPSILIYSDLARQRYAPSPS